MRTIAHSNLARRLPARWLVNFCQNEAGSTLFNEANAIPVFDQPSWEQNNAEGLILYVMNPSSIGEPPQITLKVKGDKGRRFRLVEPSNTNLGAVPLAPPGTCRADASAETSPKKNTEESRGKTSAIPATDTAGESGQDSGDTAG